MRFGRRMPHTRVEGQYPSVGCNGGCEWMPWDRNCGRGGELTGAGRQSANCGCFSALQPVSDSASVLSTER
jgi:hypothetical protein